MVGAHPVVICGIVEQDTAIMCIRLNWSSILLTFGPHGNTKIAYFEIGFRIMDLKRSVR